MQLHRSVAVRPLLRPKGRQRPCLRRLDITIHFVRNNGVSVAEWLDHVREVREGDNDDASTRALAPCATPARELSWAHGEGGSRAWTRAFPDRVRQGRASGASSTAGAQPSADKVYTVAWTIYAGWMPWPYADQAGIVKKRADKSGIKIKVVQVNDYVESLNQFSAGKVDAVTSTTMDALTVPAAGGRDTTVLMIGDYSNGNDGVILKNSSNLADIKGRSVNLVENSVSHYLLARALEKAGLKMPDVKTINTSDADIVAAFAAPQTTALVTWNPQLSEIKKQPGAERGIQLLADPRRNSRHARGRHGRVASQSKARQGADRHLVRNLGGHVAR